MVVCFLFYTWYNNNHKVGDNMFNPIRIISDYSLMQSLITLPKLIEYLKKTNTKICGLADENLFGSMEFYDLCQNNNIKPLIGLQATFLTTKITLYAQNNEGYKNLLKINTIIQQKKQLANSDVSLFKNIIAIINASDILNYDNLIPFFTKERIYIAYQNDTEKMNCALKSPNIVYAPVIRAFKKEHTKALDLLKAIENSTTLKEIAPGNYMYQTLEEHSQIEKDDEKTILDFANLINITIDKKNRYIPHFDKNIPDSFAYLKALATKGLEKRCQNNSTKQYIDRLNYELKVIKDMGFVDYFLIVYDYVKYAKTNDILVGMGRGSAAGSLVSYSLGITDVDPIYYNLLFERFLNIERVTMPDIDIDFEDDKRYQVVEYVKNKYGSDKVANIMTFGTLKCKLAVRCTCKAFQINQILLEEFAGLIDAKTNLKENLLNPKINKMLNEHIELKQAIYYTSLIEGLKKHISTHAAGIVISSIPLDEIIPLCYNAGEMLTGLTMNYLEELGLLKMDFLSIKNLTTIANVCNLIKENTGVKLKLNAINPNDPKIIDMFNKGDTLGIFQFESEGIKSFLQKLKPQNFNDIVSAIALYRPGPMDNIDKFIRRKNKEEKVTYLDPSLEPILKETYGIIIYQEQIMQILVTVGGYRYSEADIIRRAMSKKKKEIIQEGKQDFINRSIKRSYSKEIASNIYDLILKFANYGFNKSHSVSYALIGVQMAYLKCHYPLYFITNLLNMAIPSVSKTKEYMALARKYNITFLKPDINESLDTYKIINNKLILPLTIIKEIGSESANSIINERKNGNYQDFLDFTRRTYGKSVNRKTIEVLIKADAFKCFNINHTTLLANLDACLDYASLTMDLDVSLVVKPELIMYEEKNATRQEELESFGFYISNHPSLAYQNKNIMKLKDMPKNFDKYIDCVVLIEKIKKIKTKNNEDMMFIQASDETSEENFVLFNQELKSAPDIKVGSLISVHGRVTKRFSNYQININRMQILKEKEF